MLKYILIFGLIMMFFHANAQENTIKVRKIQNDTVLPDSAIVVYFGSKTGGEISVDEFNKVNALFATGSINGKPVEVVGFKVIYKKLLMPILFYQRKGDNIFLPETFIQPKHGNKLIVKDIQLKDGEGNIFDYNREIKLKIAKLKG